MPQAQSNVQVDGEMPVQRAPKPGPLVEDTTVVGGTDANGNAQIKPKPVAGQVTESGFEPTDPRE